MNIVFFILFLVSIVFLLFTDPTKILPAMQSGSFKAVELCFNLISIYAVWLGLLELVDKSSLGQKIAKIIRPITHFLFENLDSETENLVALNISSNMLGMGNASTPSGILAMEKFAKFSTKIDKNMIILLILNTCTIQILPTTIIGVRVQYGSVSPADIILPNIISSFLTTFIGIGLVIFIERIRKK